MFVRLSCPQGHHWEAAEETADLSSCPICGAAGETLIQGDTMASDDRQLDSPPPHRASRMRPSGPPPVAGGTELPEHFGRYTILGPLGRGGMGAVYLAHDSQLQRQVALKVPRFRDTDAIQRERFQREARAAATLHHPNICSVYDVGEEAGIQFLSMAYIEGEPLSQLIKDQHPLPQRAVADLVRKLALALDEAHAKGVVHRDLKPANIMIDKRHEPVIMDFGLARRDNVEDARLTAEGAVMGTPAYMAPEQVAGKNEKTGKATDVYALGVILYELLTGRLPFEGSVGEILGKIATQPPTPPSHHRADVSNALEAICLKAMRKEVDERYKSMGQLAAAIQDCLDQRLEPREPRQIIAATEGGSLAWQDPGSVSRASDLLEQLMARLESGQPESRVTVDHRIRGVWPLAAAACGALILLIALLVWAPWNDGPETSPQLVTVQLVDIDIWINDPAVTFFINQQPVGREEIAGQLSLPPGQHVLEVRRGDRLEAVYEIPISDAAAQQSVALSDHQRKLPQPDADSTRTGPAQPTSSTARQDVTPPRPMIVDPSLTAVVREYYGDTPNYLHSELTINDRPAGSFTRATQQNIADSFRAGWNTLTLETTPQRPAEQQNDLLIVFGRLTKSPDGKESVTPFWFWSNGQDWTLNDGRYRHQSGPETTSLRLTCQLYYAGFQFEDREIKDGDYVLEAKPYYGAENPSVVATVFINGTPLTSFGSQPRRAVITDLLKQGHNEIKLISTRMDNCLKDNDVFLSLSGPAEYHASQSRFQQRPMAMLSGMTGWQRNQQTGQLVNMVDPASNSVERTITLYLPEQPQPGGRRPTAPEMMTWVDKYYEGTVENPLHSEMHINDRLVGVFTSTTLESVAAPIKKNDWNKVTLRTTAQYPAGQWNELQFLLGQVERDPEGELTMPCPIWYFHNGGDWKFQDGRLTHRLGPERQDVTLTFQLYFAGLEHENKTAGNGDYVLTGKPYYADTVTSVTSTVFVNGTPLNTFSSRQRQIVITSLLKKGTNEIRLVTKRVDNWLSDNDIEFSVAGPGEYQVGSGQHVLPEITRFGSLTAWQRNTVSGQLVAQENPDLDTVERVIQFEIE